MKRHLGAVLVASLLGGLSLSGCEAVNLSEKVSSP